MDKTKTSILTLDINLVFIFYILLTVLITLLLSRQQLIVGTIVNSLLFFTAANIDKKYHLLVAIFPSIVAVFQGLLFGKFTIFLVYFLPFIWMGNYILMLTYQKINQSLIKILASAFFKFLFLYSIANFYVNLKIVPKMFLTAMGVFQLYTALLGGLVFLFINKLISTSKKND